MAALNRFALACIALALCACVAPRTQIVVRLGSDIPRGPGELTEVDLEVYSQDHVQRAHYSLYAGDASVAALPPLPADLFAVSPLGGDPTRAITVVAAAISGSTRVLTVTATASFTRDTTTVLALFLAEQCRVRNVVCPTGYSCGPDGRCEPNQRDGLPTLGGDPLPDAFSIDTPRADTDVPVHPDVPSIDVPPMDAGPVCNHDGVCDPGETACNCTTDNCPAMTGDGCCTPGSAMDCAMDPACHSQRGDGCCAPDETWCNEPGACPAVRADNCCGPGETHCSEPACPDNPVAHDGCCETGERWCDDPTVCGQGFNPADGCCASAAGETPANEPACRTGCGDGYCDGAGGEACSNCHQDCGQACQCYVRCCDGRLLGPDYLATLPGAPDDFATPCANLFRTNPCGSVGSVRAAWGTGSVCADARSSQCQCCASGSCGAGASSGACTTTHGC